ncbi:MAG: T9SS type A sorting domain-containing protein, partial [Bacteroidota bacterium]
DTQEIIVATLAAFGMDRFNSVTALKLTDLSAQEAFNKGFQWPAPPARPNVRYAEVDGKIILEWGSDLTRVLRTETEIGVGGDHAFEGYNLYQFSSPDADISEARRFATFDVSNGVRTVFERIYVEEYGTESDVAIQFGKDSGIKRFFVFDRDYIRGIEKLSNGNPYHLAVTAYSVTPHATGFQKALESNPVVLTVRPQQPFGTTLRAAFGDTVQVTRTGGTSGALLVPIVINPVTLLDASYDVAVDTNTASYQSSQIADGLVISRTDTVVHVPVKTDETAPIFDGIQWKLINAPAATDAFSVSTSALTASRDAASTQNSIARVNVFPNPYYGINSLETHRFRPFVTFNNLPRRATIRIFNLAGHLITVLQKDDDSQFLHWKLINSFNILIASGMYIAHLEFPDLGQTKILKLSVILEQVIPETY